MKRYLKYGLIGLPWLLVTATTFYLVALDGWRDVRQGRLHRMAYDMFEYRHDFTEVRIFLLQGDNSSKTDITFPIKPKNKQASRSIREHYPYW